VLGDLFLLKLLSSSFSSLMGSSLGLLGLLESLSLSFKGFFVLLLIFLFFSLSFLSLLLG